MSVTPDDEDTRGNAMLLYQERAQQVAKRVTQEWAVVHEGDASGMTDAVHRALVQEANLELRQILAQVSGSLQLAQRRASRGEPVAADRIETMLGTLDRASALLDVFLDRASAAKMTIHLEAEAFDLSEALDAHLRAHGLRERVDASFGPSPLIGDRSKLIDALGHLVTRFHFSSRPHERVVIVAGIVDDRVEGFIGLSPSHVAPEQLMEEMGAPLLIEDVGIDVGYARAVLERHGGVLFVATAGEKSAGFGFLLPVLAGGI